MAYRAHNENYLSFVNLIESQSVVGEGNWDVIFEKFNQG